MNYIFHNELNFVFQKFIQKSDVVRTELESNANGVRIRMQMKRISKTKFVIQTRWIPKKFLTILDPNDPNEVRYKCECGATLSTLKIYARHKSERCELLKIKENAEEEAWNENTCIFLYWNAIELKKKSNTHTYSINLDG